MDGVNLGLGIGLIRPGGIGAPPPAADLLLLEDGASILLAESGEFIELE